MVIDKFIMISVFFYGNEIFMRNENYIFIITKNFFVINNTTVGKAFTLYDRQIVSSSFCTIYSTGCVDFRNNPEV